MGKRLKKGQMPPGATRPEIVSKKVTKQCEESAHEEAVVTMAKNRSCVHFEKRVNLDKLLKTIRSYQQIKCGECKEGVHVKRGSEAKVDSSSNGFSSSDPNSAKKAIWLCLECGSCVCGDVGLPIGARSHVLQHIRLMGHRLVIQCENPQIRWCFPCQSLLLFEKEEHGEKKDLLLEVVKLIRERYSGTSSASFETENSCSRSGIVARDGYAVRGLRNLGNTCFFNSVMQNLLSLDQLRDHFLNEDMSGCGGPLVFSLKKLFAETKSEAWFAINPGAFFGSVCSQAPQFGGYQQHDSHELLRCLLDGLSTEELSLRNKLVVSDSDDSSTHQKPTFIDSVFGGEISSTVSCMECGHSSKVYEPFMDLSLPIPSKRPSPKTQETLSQAKFGAFSKDLEVVSAKPASDHISPVSILESPFDMARDDKQVSEIASQSDFECEKFWDDFLGVDTSDSKTDVVSQGNVVDTTPSTPKGNFDQTLIGCTETLMHDNDGNAKPESVPVKEDAQATESNDEAQFLLYPDLVKSSSSESLWDDEELYSMVADVGFKRLLDEPGIPCNDKTVRAGDGEASSSFERRDDHEQNIDYVDFSSFFDEPEVSEGPVFGPPSKADISEGGFMADSSNDKTVRASEGEAFASLVSCGHEQNIDYEPEVSEEPVFGPPSKAEICEAGFTADSSNEKTFWEREAEALTSLVSCGHEQHIDFVDKAKISKGTVFGPPSKAEVSQAGFSAVSSIDNFFWECEDKEFSSFMSRDFSSTFDKPEISNGPVFGPTSKAGFMAVNCDSDPEVLDDSDSPVSLDRCFAQFTKPEILSGDDAWHCENCSKNLKLQRLMEKRKTKERLDNGWVNENGASLDFNECRNNSLNQSCIDLENGYKAVPVTEFPNCKEEKNVSDDGGILGDSDTTQAPITLSAPETPILGGETISSQPANGNVSEKSEDAAIDSKEVIVKRDATKRVLVNKAPPILTIHLKRFSQDSRGRLSKLSGHVDFQEYLDLSQYMDCARWTEEDLPVYRLAGLVEHLGTMRGGHYVAYIRGVDKEKRKSDIKEADSSRWYYTSDFYVRRASLEEVLRSDAYILFYQRI